MIDEIHITPMVDIHLNYGTFGIDHKNPQKIAKTVFGFMIKSVFGNYQEIVSLIPSFRDTSFDLVKLTHDAMKLISDLGGKILTIITDNNRVNVKLFKLIGIRDGSLYTTNPINGDLLFAMYDTVHLLKNFRNNWHNKKKYKQKNEFYNMENGQRGKRFAKFSRLAELLTESESSALKVSSKITLKSLVPSNMEKQKVSLALKIFCFENAAGLRYLAEKYDKPEYIDTAIFIEKFTKWFEILNVKTPDKGSNMRDLLLNPIDSIDDSSLNHLREFVKWMLLQKPLRNKFLTEQTFNACYVTTNAFLRCCEQLLSEGYHGILSGVFQTDPLEKRFGQRKNP